MRDNLTLIKDSWSTLKGKWGVAIGAIFVVIIAQIGVEFCFDILVTNLGLKVLSISDNTEMNNIFTTSITSIVGLIAFSIYYPMNYGYTIMLLNISRGFTPNLEFLTEGYKCYLRFAKVLLWTLLYMLPFIVFNIAVFVYYIQLLTTGETEIWMHFVAFTSLILTIYIFIDYSFLPYVMYDEQNLSPKEVVLKSKALVQTNKMSLIILDFILILINILGFIFLIIGSIWTITLSQVALASFYNDIKLEYEMTNNPNYFNNSQANEMPTESNYSPNNSIENNSNSNEPQN